MKKICLTGGGTAGHVNPNIALIPILKEQNYDIIYIGSKKGIEKELIEKVNIEFFSISSGKLRRYLDVENIKDIFRVLKGVKDAYTVLKKNKPDIVFSKGGFVTVPVCIAANLLKIPVVIHESDITPGLANKIASKFAKTICVSFPETLKYVGSKGVLTGSPIRDELLHADKEKGLKICGFDNKKPVVLAIGGSLGSKAINETLRKALPSVLEKFQVVHVCGKANLDETISLKGYKQFEYLNEELPHVLNCTDIVISRAGANAIFEFLALKKPALLIPLPKTQSRGDQILNADSFLKQGYADVLEEENMNEKILAEKINSLFDKKDEIIKNMSENSFTNGIYKIVEIINKACGF